MSKKFEKNRSVSFSYFAIPLYYTGIKHPNNNDKELVLIDDYSRHYLAAYRNNSLCKVGIHFILKKEMENGKSGFIFKGKFFQLRKYGWVF
ncbi:MAG: hypothetical protein LBV69_06700 [Bacteroidales bacterium]|jgi:hypothetical protein|nr:hypothetical protein [Bacteroidales bacterium]